MNPDRTIWTFHDGAWQEGNVPVLGSADHATWLGTLVFDGARRFDGVTPDLDRHAARLNKSALALGLTPTHDVDTIVSLTEAGLERFPAEDAVYIRPMYWSTGFGEGVIVADPDSTAFCLCLEAVPMPPPDITARLGTTRYRRPTLDTATVDAKAACLYPNNARMMQDVLSRGFTNAIVQDLLGNVAESATSNLFLARDGEVFTPIPNGCFLNGITRQRTIALLRADGLAVHETTLTLGDFAAADEVFLSGNLAKITPVTAIESTTYEIGPIALRARALYMDWARSSRGSSSAAPAAATGTVA